MKVADLKIDDDFKNLLRPLTAEEMSGLEKDILTHGVLDPIIVWDGFIVDGHNRYDICVRHGIEEVQTKELLFSKKSDAMQWANDHQDSRRNQTMKDKMRSAMAIKKQIEMEAKANHSANGGDRRSSKYQKSESSTLNSPKNKIRSSAEAAKVAGVSENTYRAREMVELKGTEEQKERMYKGGKGNGAIKIANEIKEAEQKQEPQKICTRCGKSKPISMFRKKKDNHYDSWCRECENEERKFRQIEIKKNDPIKRVIYEAKDANRDTSVTFEEFLQEMQYIASSFVDNYLSAMRRNASLFDTAQKKKEVVKIAIEAIKTIRKEEDM